MIDKRFYIPGTDPQTQLPTVLDIHSPLIKEASATLPARVKNKISSIPKEEGYSYVLLTAVEAGEYWGSNKRGDYFIEQGPPSEYDQFNGKILWGLKLEHNDFGYKTFLKAKLFVEHRSSDPNRSAGIVVDAFYDENMHRVDLILKVDRNKALQIGMHEYLAALDNDLPLDYSMGCRTPFDVCSIHGDLDRVYSILAKHSDPLEGVKALLKENKERHIPGVARVVDYNPNDPRQKKAGIQPTDAYCELRKHHMNELLPDGRKIYNVTTHPVFYDISWVRIGAGPIAKNITKLASAYEINPGKYVAGRYQPTQVFISKTASATKQKKFSGIKELLQHQLPITTSEATVRSPKPLNKYELLMVRALVQRAKNGPLLPYRMLTDNFLEELLHILEDIKVLMHPREFYTAALARTRLAPAIYQGRVQIANTVGERPLDALLHRVTGYGLGYAPADVLSRISLARSLDPKYLGSVEAVPLPQVQAVRVMNNPYLAMCYNTYRNAALAKSVPAGLVPELLRYLR